MGRERKNVKSRKVKGVKSKKVVVSRGVAEGEAEVKQPPLYTLELCETCTRDCKIAGIRGSELVRCPDYKKVS